MMNRTKTLYARAGATAIAAALALSSTTLFAQDTQQAQPAPTDPAPAATSVPGPAVDSTPVSVDSSASAPDQADTPVASKTTTKRTTVKRTTHVASATPEPAPAKPVSRTRTASKPAAPASSVTMAQTSQSTVKPIIDMNKKPAATARQARPARKKDDTPIIAAGGALAFLAIGGAAVGLTRRRREDDEDMIDRETFAHQPVDATAAPAARDEVFEQEPPMIAPEASAFAWGNDAAAEQSDRRPGETWVERAYRGPSPENPSLSLRKRLKRAAFFDRREREVAAGSAEPVDPEAGLPEAMADEPQLETV